MTAGIARVCARNNGRFRKSGMTMIEMIVVLAIIAIMTAVVVPTFVRLGYFSRNDVQASARELHMMLKAAKIYASTYRVNTAVVYSIVPKNDSITGTAVQAFDAAALVYKLPRAIVDATTFQDAVANSSDTHDDAYVPVVTDESGAFFRSLKQDTTILPDGNGVDATNLWSSLNEVRLYRVDAVSSSSGAPKYTATPIAPLIEYKNVTDGFPAHIFRSTGSMIFTDTELQRVRMYVGYAPDASPTERYADEGTKELRADAIELVQSTGRVQIVED